MKTLKSFDPFIPCAVLAIFICLAKSLKLKTYF